MSLFGSKQTVRLQVESMTCQNCARHVAEALEGVSGVAKADVDLDAGRAEVTIKGDVDLEALTAAVAEAGYPATPG